MSTHRSSDARASRPGLEAREHEGDPLERQREADDAATVDCRLEVAGIELGGRGDLGQDLVLERVAGEPVALRWPAACPTRREHSGVFA